MIFDTYGFQFASITAVITFFVTRYFNIKDKKIELKHGLYQELKVQSINNFIECYSTSELCWVQIPYYEILGNELSAKQIDDLTIPTFNSFTASYYKLFIILDEEELPEFIEIYHSIVGIKKLLSDLKNLPARESVSTRADTYISSVSLASRENGLRIRKIGEKFRAKYN